MTPHHDRRAVQFAFPKSHGWAARRSIVRSRIHWAWLLFLTGCGDRAFELAHKAEDRGDPQVAYEYYCRAVAEHPGSGVSAAGIVRERPGAAAYWESQALVEMDAGHYDDAWRMLMKALEIQPDSTITARLIRQIEEQHHDQIALARTEWMRRGSTALASAVAGRRQRQPLNGSARPDQIENQLAQALIEPETSDASQDIAGNSQPPGTLLSADAVAGQLPGGMESQSGASPQSVAISAAVGRDGERLIRIPEVPVASASPRETIEQTQPDSARDERLDETETTGNSGSTKKPARPPILGTKGDYLVLQTLSLKDRAYPNVASFMDKIEIRLKDTDVNLTADLDIYAGRTRIKKIRVLRIGRSLVFGGPSGGLYRLTLLGIHHKTRTVRVGIKPA